MGDIVDPGINGLPHISSLTTTWMLVLLLLLLALILSATIWSFGSRLLGSQIPNRDKILDLVLRAAAMI